MPTMTLVGPVDVVVVGSGPAGLAAAAEVQRRGARAVVLERLVLVVSVARRVPAPTLVVWAFGAAATPVRFARRIGAETQGAIRP